MVRRALRFLPVGPSWSAASDMADDFVVPDPSSSLVVAEYLQLVPKAATIKGLFITSVIEELGTKRQQLAESSNRYTAFKDYPLTLQVKLIAEVARLAHPEVPLREGIRRVGLGIYPRFAASLLGKVLFSAVGTDPVAMMRAGSKAYASAASVGSVELVHADQGSATLRLQAMYNFIDCYQVGILQGAFSVLGIKS